MPTVLRFADRRRGAVLAPRRSPHRLAHAAGALLVEYVPRTVERAGLMSRGGRPVSTTFLASHASRAYGGASNTPRGEDAVVGLVPTYTVFIPAVGRNGYLSLRVAP